MSDVRSAIIAPLFRVRLRIQSVTTKNRYSLDASPVCRVSLAIPRGGLCAVSVANRGLLGHKLRHLLLDDAEKQLIAITSSPSFWGHFPRLFALSNRVEFVQPEFCICPARTES
jgi:hypothetical protein